MRSNVLACVLGDMDLVRPLGLAGIPVAAVAPAGHPTRFSRFTRARVDFPAGDDAEIAEALGLFGARQARSPVLFYEDDWHVRIVSRERERLARSFRFVIADRTLVEDLLDKERFQGLARRLGLPVPHGRSMRPADEPAPGDDLALPILLKPIPSRNDRWRSVEPRRKALLVETRSDLRELWTRFGAAGAELLVQEFVAGPEHRIESYHVYVDADGEVVADFTGRKLRTFPPALGHSTALTISDAPDVRAAGRALVEQLGLTGVAKADFKRGPDGFLHLLEVNPRFNLWHHLAAVAGLNLPAIVHADLTGDRRPLLRRARVGATWSLPWLDLRTIRAQRESQRRWARWVLGCDALSVLAWDDPLPFLAGKVGAAAVRAAHR